MTALRLAVLLLYAAAAAAAVLLALRSRRHKPVAWYLSAVFALDLVRLGLSLLLPSSSEPREGLIVLLRHVDQAAYLGLILALPEMTIKLFLRRQPWSTVGAVYAVFLVLIVVFYPELRGAELMMLYSAIELAGGVASAGFFWMWASESGEGLSTSTACGIVLTAGSLAVSVLPSLAGEALLSRWPISVALHGVFCLLVLVLQLRDLWHSRKPSEYAGS